MQRARDREPSLSGSVDGAERELVGGGGRIVGNVFGAADFEFGPAEDTGIGLAVGAEKPRPGGLVPFAIGGPDGGGPHELEVAGEFALDLDGLPGADGKPHDQAGFGGAGGQGLLHLEFVAGIRERVGTRARPDRPDKGFGGDDSGANLEPETEIFEDLHRVHPGFERAVLSAEERGPGTDRVEELPGSRGTGDFKVGGQD